MKNKIFLKEIITNCIKDNYLILLGNRKTLDKFREIFKEKEYLE